MQPKKKNILRKKRLWTLNERGIPDPSKMSPESTQRLDDDHGGIPWGAAFMAVLRTPGRSRLLAAAGLDKWAGESELVRVWPEVGCVTNTSYTRGICSTSPRRSHPVHAFLEPFHCRQQCFQSIHELSPSYPSISPAMLPWLCLPQGYHLVHSDREVMTSHCGLNLHFPNCS